MPDYGLKKDVAGKPYAQKKGKYAAKNTGCCCTTANCANVWVCTPCFAGTTTSDPVCGCPAGYPRLPIYLCVDAKCDCTGAQIQPGQTIRASYRFAPGVEWCFAVTNVLKSIIDLDPEDTVVGLAPDCVKCATGGCNDDACKKPKGRFIRPRRCDPQDPRLCAWVCANDVHDCSVHQLFTGDYNNTACCSFIGGPLDEHYFTECPNLYDYWTGIGVKSCCACENCGGVVDFDQDTYCSPGCTCISPTFPGGHLECCCGDILSASASFSSRLDFTSPDSSYWANRYGSCSYSNGAGQCHFYFTDSNGANSDYTQGWYPSCYGSNIGSVFTDANANRMEVCQIPQQHTTFSGSKTWNCNGGSVSTVATTTYNSPTIPKRVEHTNTTYSMVRSNAPKCRAACGDGNINRVPSKTIVSVGTGVFM